MKTVAAAVMISLSLVVAPVLAAAQPNGESADESARDLEESFEEMAEFIRDVTFDEGDVKSVIEHWGELNAMDEDESWEAVDDEDEMVDFEALLAYPTYRSWAKSKGLDPDTWLRKFMRIQAMLMKEETSEGVADGASQVKQQLADLEAQRAQLGEEMYQQMKAAMEGAAGMMGSLGSVYDKLPDPTPAERRLLERYRDQLMNLE